MGKVGQHLQSVLAAQGWDQVSGKACGGTFAPISRRQSIGVVLTFAAEKNWEVHHLDVQTAFLHADVEEDAYYVKMAPGHKTTDRADIPLVMELKESLGGMAQSPDN